MRILNYLLVFAILCGIAYVLNRKYKNTVDMDYLIKEDDDDENKMDCPHICAVVDEAFTKKIRTNLKDENYTKEQYEQKEKQLSLFKEAMNSAAYCDMDAKRIVMSNIREVVRNKKLGLTEVDLNKIIPFDNPDNLSHTDKFEILKYVYDIKKDFADDWLSAIIDEYKLTKPIFKDGKKRYKFTREHLDGIYEDQLEQGNIVLEENDKVEIIAQRIFESNIGFGCIDVLIEANIDEIDCGVSGITSISKRDRKGNASQRNLPQSFESIWITYGGLKMQLECLAFESEDEFNRVCDNIYKYNPPKVLSRTDCMIQAEMKDGSRLSITRPPKTECCSFWLRKFGSAKGRTLESLLNKSENFIIVAKMMKWLIKSNQTGGITGAQNTGKTTFLRACVEHIREEYAIRTVEDAFELRLKNYYPDRNIQSFQNTPEIGMQETLDFLKKTNSDVTIVGEAAHAEQTSFIVQTSGVASYFTMFTSHHNTAKKLIEGCGDDLMKVGQAASKEEAYKQSSASIQYDCHIVNNKGNRHPSRITEIIPVEADELYPSQKDEMSLEEAVNKDTLEYYRRQTNPLIFTTRDLVRWYRGKFYLVNLPSDAMLKRIENNLTDEELKEFYEDMKLMQELSKDYKKDVEAGEQERRKSYNSLVLNGKESV